MSPRVWSTPTYPVAGEVGSIVITRGASPDRPALLDIQLDPPFVDLKTPPGVPAYRTAGVAGCTASTETCVASPNPLLTGAQLRPLSTLLKAPASVPA